MLENIKKPNDVKKIPEKDLPALAREIRHFLVSAVSRTGGHLASNLGVVEMTIALHRVFTLPEDKIIWDVGHQAYTHKILTGRKKEFRKLRRKGGISGFPRRRESCCDSFDTGHSSTSISAGLGYVKARDLRGEDHAVVSVIGDGSLTGGLAFEAMNNAAELKTNYIIVLNDNHMSISRNVGGISTYLGKVRTSSAYTGLKMGVSAALGKIPGVGEDMIQTIRRTKSSIKTLFVPGMFFEDMGLTYLGPVDGYNISQMEHAFAEARNVQGPVLVHVVTQKGRGYAPAQKDPSSFHGTSGFRIRTGEPLKKASETYSDVFSKTMLALAEQDPYVAAVTAAMAEGTGLKKFRAQYPERFFDVGIAEGHAVTFCAGLALGGLKPVFAVYSSFLQRGFDQLMMDICMQNVHAVFAIDRAGLVGADGKTHQGCFDLSYLNMMPGMTVMAPKNDWELGEMLKFAVNGEGTYAIRYPRGAAWKGLPACREELQMGRAEVIRRGSGAALLAAGAMVQIAEEAAELLADELAVTVVNMRFIKPFDRDMIRTLAESHELLLTMEENVRIGGFGQQVLEFAQEEKLPAEVQIAALPDQFIGHAGVEEQRAQYGLDAASVADRIRNTLGLREI